MQYNMKILFLISLLITAVIMYGCNAKQDGAAAKDLAKTTANSQKAAGFVLKALDGDKVRLESYKGKVLLLNVWDTWCPPCRAEIPAFIELYDKYKSMGFEILGVAGGQQGVRAVESFVKDYGINYPIALITADFYQAYAPLQSIPTTFLIDRHGNIHKKYIGARPKSVFERDILEALDI
jgi:peroxiredoxin